MNLGRSLLNHGDAERARAVTANGLSIERGNTPIRQMLLYNRALCEIEQKHFDTAWQTLIEALTLNPHHLDYLFLRAHVAFEQGRWLDCILSLRAYQSEQTRQRSNLRVNNLLTDYYDAGVRAHVLLGHAYAHLGHSADARSCFRDALLMESGDAAVWRGYIAACEAMGDRDAVAAGAAEALAVGIVV